MIGILIYKLTTLCRLFARCVPNPIEKAKLKQGTKFRVFSQKAAYLEYFEYTTKSERYAN